MWARVAAVLCAVLALLGGPPSSAEPCPHPNALGVARVIEIDPSGSPYYGAQAVHPPAEALLKPKEVVLTFDDGPLPGVTRSILDTLDRFCTKATFFSVGQMALTHPELVKAVIAGGHTLGAHTLSHPQPFSALSVEAAREEIDRGFAAVAHAAGRPIAPFFRFPGLRHTTSALEHLRMRGVAVFGVDVISDDSFISDPDRLAQLVLQRVEARRGGIMLFHDIKQQSALALPKIFSELGARGYQVVHLTAKRPMPPIEISAVPQGPMRVRAEITRSKKGIGSGAVSTAANTGATSGDAVAKPEEQSVQPLDIPVPVLEAVPDAGIPTAGRWSMSVADPAHRAREPDANSPAAGRWSSTANRLSAEPAQN